MKVYYNLALEKLAKNNNILNRDIANGLINNLDLLNHEERFEIYLIAVKKHYKNFKYVVKKLLSEDEFNKIYKEFLFGLSMKKLCIIPYSFEPIMLNDIYIRKDLYKN